ncbi:MAG: response regulator [Zetaproteobacteria bacterium]|nr:MAG: response regulator [Zetaproteobacteria bacterium]
MNDEARRRLAMMDREIKQCTEMINRLRMFAHPEADEKKPIPAARFMLESGELIRMSLPENVDFERDIRLPEDVAMLGDANQLKQMLINLSNNAVHALRNCAQPRIRLRARLATAEELARLPHEADRALLLCIEDNGAGMSEEVRARIFDPFFTTKPAGEGTGLGLSMVHAAVRAHGGAITVHSAPEAGTRIEITLPLTANSATQTAAQRNAEPVPGHGETLLLIDDDTFLLQTNAELLRSIGYQVLTAENGEQALRLAAEKGERIAAIVSDIVMPEMSGPETIQRLADAGFQRPTMFITGYDQDQQANKLPAGLKAPVLRKPVHIAELSRALAQLLAASR